MRNFAAMYFEQKIYINNKPLILTNMAEQYINNHPIAAGYLFLTGAFHRNITLAQKHLSSMTSLGAVIEDISADALQKLVRDSFTMIDAAGGVVSNENGDVLMIYRRGKWDLPKGKRDEGETVEECAVREVSEETGLEAVKIKQEIAQTYHIYAQGKGDILKHTFWYDMSARGSDTLKPQAAENILEARWIPVHKLNLYMHQTYEAIKEVLSLAGKKM